MIPVRVDNPTQHAPMATYLLIAGNVLAWAWLQGLGTEPALSRSICDLGAIPGEFLGTVGGGMPVHTGSRHACFVAREPNWITPLSSMFLHGGWLHLIGNMWFLSVFGGHVEEAIGRLRFLLFYLVCGLAAVAAQTATDVTSTVPMIGASGAIGGVMGAYAVLYPATRVHMVVFLGVLLQRIVVPAVVVLGCWFVLQLVLAIPTIGDDAGGVAFWAHVGGFAAGVALGFAVRDPERLASQRLWIKLR